MRRRDFCGGLGVVLAGCTKAGSQGGTGIARGVPEPRWGIQSGDVSQVGAVVWSRADRASSTMRRLWPRSHRG